MKIYIYIFQLLILVSCSSELPMEEYLNELEKEENQLKKSKSINGIELSVKYLPAELLTYQEFARDKYLQDDPDSVFQQFKNGYSFLLSFAPDKKLKIENDALLIGLKSFEEFDDRVRALNFEVQNFTSLEVDGKIEKPILSMLGGSYGLKSKKTVMLTFLSKENFSELVFVLDDPFFHTGKTKFKFLKSDIESFPQLLEWNQLNKAKHNGGEK